MHIFSEEVFNHGQGILHEVQEEGRDEERKEDNDEERKAGHQGRLSKVRHQGLQDRRYQIDLASRQYLTILPS